MIKFSLSHELKNIYVIIYSYNKNIYSTSIDILNERERYFFKKCQFLKFAKKKKQKQINFKIQ